MEHWKKRARRAERAQSRNERVSRTLPHEAGDPMDQTVKKRKRTVSIRRYRINPDGTKTLVCVIKPDRAGSISRPGTSMTIKTDMGLDLSHIAPAMTPNVFSPEPKSTSLKLDFKALGPSFLNRLEHSKPVWFNYNYESLLSFASCSCIWFKLSTHVQLLIPRKHQAWQFPYNQLTDHIFFKIWRDSERRSRSAS